MDNERGFCVFLKDRLTKELLSRDRSGVYGFTQRLMGYNSSRIEGSRLTEVQTQLLFEGTVAASTEDYRAKDIEEMTGHFSMFNFMVETIDEPLSIKIIKQLHYRLKSGVFEDRANGNAIGSFKTRPNLIGNYKTSRPEKVLEDITGLLSYYDRYSNSPTVLTEFHAMYEVIHPFQDGNGRTGRVILFRECLRKGICPIIIRDVNKSRYYNGLIEYREQGTVSSLLELFEEEKQYYYKKASYFM